jgi:hypothetical protein
MGRTIRPHEIYCHGLVLRVTTNLLELLQSLRSSGETRRLWIDALCINQDDLDEQSQQVPLMAEIYQKTAVVLIWIGQAISSTRQACGAIHKPADSYDIVTSKPKLKIDDTRFRCYKHSSEIPEEALHSISQEPRWLGVMDLLCTRTYFQRLWIVQEIVLSSYAIVICGDCRVNWVVFHKADMVIWCCRFLQDSIIYSQDHILPLVKTIGGMRSDFPNISLTSLLLRTLSLHSTHPLLNLKGDKSYDETRIKI